MSSGLDKVRKPHSKDEKGISSEDRCNEEKMVPSILSVEFSKNTGERGRVGRSHKSASPLHQWPNKRTPNLRPGGCIEDHTKCETQWSYERIVQTEMKYQSFSSNLCFGWACSSPFRKLLHCYKTKTLYLNTQSCMISCCLKLMKD